jgi:RHS repeat-associated protein
VFFYTTEQPGSVINLVNKSNQIVNSYEYDPYGNALTRSEQVPQPFQFSASFFDPETGLYFMRARYYDPQLARFISEDPVGIGGQGAMYAFVGDDPINATDPNGLDDRCKHGWHIKAQSVEDDGMTLVTVCQQDGGSDTYTVKSSNTATLPDMTTTAPRTPMPAYIPVILPIGRGPTSYTYSMPAPGADYAGYSGSSFSAAKFAPRVEPKPSAREACLNSLPPITTRDRVENGAAGAATGLLGTGIVTFFTGGTAAVFIASVGISAGIGYTTGPDIFNQIHCANQALFY